MEPVDLWKKGVPEKYREAAPLFPPHKLAKASSSAKAGTIRTRASRRLEVDGLSAEGATILPTLMLKLFALEDAGLQEACFRVYNDWLIEYCSVNGSALSAWRRSPCTTSTTR